MIDDSKTAVWATKCPNNNWIKNQYSQQETSLLPVMAIYIQEICHQNTLIHSRTWSSVRDTCNFTN